MNQTDLASETRSIQRVTVLGMVVNIVLAVFKLIVGYLSHSLGLVADGVHSLSDLITDVVVILGARISGRPPDQNHPFGHGKFETMSVVLIGVILIVVGVGIGREGYQNLSAETTPPLGIWIIVISLVSVGVKETLYHMTVRVARECRSSSLIANAWHHRSDAFSSIVVLGGGVASMFGWIRADSIAGIVVGGMVAFVGLKLGFEAIKELTEASPGHETEERITGIISTFEEVRGWHRLRTRRLGRELEMDIHILINPELTIDDGHKIVERIEEALVRDMDWPINPTIHIDPDNSAIREACRKRDRFVLR